MAPIWSLLAVTALILQAIAAPYVTGNSALTSNLKDIPSVGLGTWLSDRDKVADAVEYALKAGYRHIDAAWIYKNEDKTGQGLSAALKSTKSLSRKDIWITSKLWNAHHRPKEATAAIQETLTNLAVDYLDLYLIHWPVAFVPHKGDELDKSVSLIDTWRTMENLVRANLTRYIGISNFARHEVEEILEECVICPYAHEFETHPYLQQGEFVEWHKGMGMKVIAYSPFGDTNPTYRGSHIEDDGKKKQTLLKDPFWVELAEKKNSTVAQAVLGWGLERKTVVIPKSTSKEHLAENLKAADRIVEFTFEEMEEIGKRDKKTRMNNPGRAWGVDLFSDLDDPTKLEHDEVFGDGDL
ncbi:NADP-dependent oxidoreductase domain-containing protein [Rhypophila decipiens]|uniref:NADP-dependent oxidoreductase domain-containing protein n=1 Tax=Rhypophila decipiens TaxID=261697 RepID=A0AAN7B7N2_9PEZI|nr:NADP-dependent oxidoreductase domain-containing protein [Rhypophila decipiens]